MNKHLKRIAWLLAILLMYCIAVPAAGTGDNATTWNSTEWNTSGGNSTGGNSTGGNSTGVDEYDWRISIGGESNYTITGTSSVSSSTLNLVSNDSVQITLELAAQLGFGPLPTGTDRYTRKENDAGCICTFDLNGDGTADLGLTHEHYSAFYLKKLSGAASLTKNYTFSYPAPSQSNIVLYSPVTINFPASSSTTTTPPGEDSAEDKAGYYEIRNGSAVFIRPKNRNAAKLTIPASVKGKSGKSYKVTEIAPKACKGMKKLKTLVIGKNVKTIGASAFYQCKKLMTVTVGKNVTTIGKKAFYQCKALKKLIFKGKKLKKTGSKAFGKIGTVPTVKCPKGKAKAFEKLLKKGGLKKATYVTK